MILDDDIQIVDKARGAALQEAQFMRAAKDLQLIYLLYISNILRLVSPYFDVVNFQFGLCKNGKNFWKSTPSFGIMRSAANIPVYLDMYYFKPGYMYDANDLSKLVLFFKHSIKSVPEFILKDYPEHYFYFRRDLIKINRRYTDKLISE